MKLTFRGHAYEAPAPIQLGSVSIDQPQIKLIYRGHTYDYTPRPVVVSEVVETDEPTVTLIYRGNIYERNLQAPKAYQKPRAINWRWQF
jgi:homogentisate 1,2-dioxygenase